MKKISEYLFLWGIGGWIYYSLEIIFRGFSHWSMFVLGGICMMFFTYQGELVHWQDDFLRQVLRCSIFVTAMEFITGIIVNKWFALHVWDYSCMPFQLFGQICLPFMLLFACLCAVGIYLSANILNLLYGEACEFHVTSVAGEGTEVTFRIPVMQVPGNHTQNEI